MMTNIPFGIAEIDGEKVAIAELTFPEVAAFINFVPNHDLILSMVNELDFSGYISTHPHFVSSHLGETQNSLIMNEALQHNNPFEKMITQLVPIGIQSLEERGLLISGEEENEYKTHRSLDSILKILSNPIEHMSYKTLQVPIADEHNTPILRSSLYAVQSFSGDWLLAEHFQSHQHIRLLCIPNGGKLSQSIDKILAEGIERSVTSTLSSENGTSYKPFSMFLSRTNEHGAVIIASTQLGDNDKWYTAYEPSSVNKLLGEHISKFDNIFATVPIVAQIASAQYNQIDIRNGYDDWFEVGSTSDLINEVDSLMKLTLHSQADHLPDTIPDFFFDETGENS